MQDVDPKDPLIRDPVAPELLDPPELRDVEDDSAARFGVIGMFAVLVAAVLVGLFYWDKKERLTDTAMNSTPGVTTGASPPPPLIPPGRASSTKQ